MKSKTYRELQEFDNDLLYFENGKLMRHFKHFKERYQERYSEYPLNYHDYWHNWIRSFVGKFVCLSTDGNLMTRVLGSYIKDPIVYKIVYIKVEEIGIFVPLTIMDISEHKKKARLFRKLSKNKEHKLKIRKNED